MDPQSLAYRSPVYRKLREIGARFAEVNGYAVATAIGDSVDEVSAARNLGLCDCSGIPRVGLKGRGAIQWISAQGFAVPDESNRALRQDDGSVLARLAPGEVFILGDIDHGSPVSDRLKSAWEAAGDPAAAPRGFILPRQDTHAWFRVTGRHAAEMMAKICGVDLRAASFAELQIAQTSVARLSAVVIRHDMAGVPAFELLIDSASAGYFWDCLLDAGTEFSIQVVGVNALRVLNRR